VIFASLDDATGLVELVFFEAVQDRCAARVFGSWLLVAAGRLRRVGRSVSVTGAECWDLAALAEIRAAAGIGAVRAAMAAGDVPAAPGPAARDSAATAGGPAVIRFASGFTQSLYAETGSPGGSPAAPPRTLWHASPGSSGGWAGPQSLTRPRGPAANPALIPAITVIAVTRHDTGKTGRQED
jgi:error-prone DNA polymerase